MVKKSKKIGSVMLCMVLLLSIVFIDCDLTGLLDIFAVKVSAVSKENYNMPKNGEEIRDLAEEHVKQMADVMWTCNETIDFSMSTDWTRNLVYKAGNQYIGVPYVSNRMDGDSDVYEFFEALDENRVYTGPTTWQTMLGSDCGGAPRLGFAWSGALYNSSAGNDFSYEPLKENFAKGLAPVGDYAWEKYDAAKQKPNNETIMPATGKEKMYECYSQIKHGDVVWTFMRLGENSFGEHIRFAISSASTYKNANGTINASKSYIRVIEQTSSIRKNSDGTYSTWNTQNYSFAELYRDGYIPLTMEAYSKTSVEYPEFEMDSVNITGKVDAFNLLSGRINCNYNIFEVKAEITDKEGNVVSTGTLYPYMITADLAKMKFSTPLTEVKPGQYHYTLKAIIGYGEKTLIETDITYTGIEEMVVYISDDGTGNGSSPENALGNAEGYENITNTSFKNSALYRAVQFLSQTGGTIVVCGKISIISGHYYGSNGSWADFTIPGVPVDDVTVKLTSVYGGVDYREQGASITFERTIRNIPLLELKINTEWDKIDLMFNNEYRATKETIIACGNNKTVIGPDVNIRVFYDGDELEASTSSANIFPIICGGYRYSVEPGDTDLTVLGGTWRAVVAGPCGVDSISHGILDGNTNVTIGQNAVVLGDVFGGSYDTHGSVSGNIKINITGGTVHRDIILAGNGGVVGDSSTATLTVTGAPQLLGEVKIIGPNARNNAPAATILDFTDSLSEAKLPIYTASDFSEIRKQVIKPRSDTTENTNYLKNTKTDNNIAPKENDSILLIICSVVAVAVILIVAIIPILKKRK